MLHAVVYEDRGFWVAHCLEHNLTASSKQREGVIGKLERVLSVQAEADREAGREPFSTHPPAPASIQALSGAVEVFHG